MTECLLCRFHCWSAL